MPQLERSTFTLSLLISLAALGCASHRIVRAGGAPSEGEHETLATTGGYKGKFNNDLQGHADFCVKLRSATVELRYADGAPTGFSLTPEILVPQPGSGVWCPERGMARLDAREVVRARDGTPMLFHRGGWGFAGNDPESGVHYGHILASDIDSVGVKYERAPSGTSADSMPATPHGRWVSAPTVPWTGAGQQAGNGAPCDSLSTEAYTVSVQSIPADMKYLNSAQTAAIPYAIYGSPATDLGPAADRARGIRYTMLTWSWINVRGGGVARALVSDGGTFHRCTDVPSIRLASVSDAQRKTPTGWVEAVYGSIPIAKGLPLFGWIVAAHRHGGDAVVPHLTK